MCDVEKMKTPSLS